MPTDEKIILLLAGTLCLLALMFGGASIFMPGFAREGAAVVGAIGGLLVLPITTWMGLKLARSVKRTGSEEDADA